MNDHQPTGKPPVPPPDTLDTPDTSDTNECSNPATSAARVEYLTVPESEEGQRLDRWLKKKGLPFALIQKAIRKKQITLDGKRTKPETRLKAGQRVRIPPLDSSGKNAKQHQKQQKLSKDEITFIKSIVIYDCEGILAINKPAGISTQGGTKTRKHIDRLLPALADEKGNIPKLVHRLDKATSGVLLLAKTPDMARKLGELFKNRKVVKKYWGLTAGVPEIDEGQIRIPIIKAGGRQREKMIPDPQNGQTAITEFEVMEKAGKEAAFIEFTPKTGRKHQIRVHTAYMKCPLIGDGKYGGAKAFIKDIGLSDRMHLHARSVEFIHPNTAKPVEIVAQLPPELKKSWNCLGFSYN